LRPPCEIVTQTLLPLIRGLVAQELIQSMTQQEVAEKMGLSQPTISSYLKSLKKLQEKGEEEYLENESIKKLVLEITQEIINDSSSEEIIRSICSTCVSLRIGGLTCRKHISLFPGVDAGCQGCLPLVDKAIVDKRRVIIEELKEVANLVENDDDFVKLIPQVLMNVCQCIPDATTIDDVAAFPGRITKVRGKTRALLSPEFGVSEHMAKILIRINQLNSSICSTICTIYNPKIITILVQKNIPILKLSNEEFLKAFSLDNLTQPMTSQEIKSHIASTKDKEIFVIVNQGGIGIEPITYLFAKNSQDLIKFSKDIAKTL
jgi:predicted fused transcriptional regulator/phosphomethylpyrimidine kinase/predicted transcriptional regulator